MLRFRSRRPLAGLGLILALLAGCSTPRESELNRNMPAHMQFGFDAKGRVVTNYKVGNPYQVAGKWYYPAEDYNYREEGIASWYGPGFHGKRTANGEIYDMNALTAAHKTLPMPSVVMVTNLENGRAMKVRVNDRGPFVDGRIIDLSRRAAQLMGMEQQGTARVLVELVPEDSMTLKNIAMDQSKPPTLEAPEVKAAPRDPVVAESLDPPSMGSESSRPSSPPNRPTNIASNPQLSSPSINRPSAPRAPQPTQPTVSRPAQPSAPSRPSMPSRPAPPQQVAATPAPSSPPITRTNLPSPPTSPPPVSTASAPNPSPSLPSPSGLSPSTGSPSVTSSSGSGVNLPSVSDVTSAAESALKSQTSSASLAESATDMLPTPQELLERQLQNDGSADGTETSAAEEANRLEPPENIQLPDGVFIQAGAFSDINNARRLEAQLSGLGNVFVAMVDVGGQVLHRVRVGPIPDRTVADQLLEYMQTEGYGEARIVDD